MERIELNQISEGTKTLIENLIIKSYEGEYLGLESYANFIEDVVQGVELSTDVARDNVLIYGGYDPLYIEEREDSMMIKEGLNEEEMLLASKQLDAYVRELAFLSMVNFKIKQVHRLILEGALS